MYRSEFPEDYTREEITKWIQEPEDYTQEEFTEVNSQRSIQYTQEEEYTIVDYIPKRNTPMYTNKTNLSLSLRCTKEEYTDVNSREKYTKEECTIEEYTKRNTQQEYAKVDYTKEE